MACIQIQMPSRSSQCDRHIRSKGSAQEIANVRRAFCGRGILTRPLEIAHFVASQLAPTETRDSRNVEFKWRESNTIIETPHQPNLLLRAIGVCGLHKSNRTGRVLETCIAAVSINYSTVSTPPYFGGCMQRLGDQFEEASKIAYPHAMMAERSRQIFVGRLSSAYDVSVWNAVNTSTVGDSDIGAVRTYSDSGSARNESECVVLRPPRYDAGIEYLKGFISITLPRRFVGSARF